MKRILFSLFVLIFLAGCTRYYYYQPASTQPGQKEAVYTRGLPGLRSQQFGADLTAGLSSKGESDLSLQLYLYNESDSAYTFQPEDILVTGYDAFGQKQPLRVFGAQEYKKWKRNRDILIGTAVVVGTVALILIVHELTDDNKKSSRGGNSNRPEWSSGYFYDPVGWIDFSLNTALIVNAASSNPPPQSDPAIPDDGLLRAHTLYPGEAMQGIVKVRGKTNFMQRILVEIPVNGAYHQFIFYNREPAR